MEKMKSRKGVLEFSSNRKIFPCKTLSNAWKNNSQMVQRVAYMVGHGVLPSSVAITRLVVFVQHVVGVLFCKRIGL